MNSAIAAVAEEWLQKQQPVFQKHLEFKLIVVMQTAFAVASPSIAIDCNDFPALHPELRGWQNDVQTHQSRLQASHVDFFRFAVTGFSTQGLRYRVPGKRCQIRDFRFRGKRRLRAGRGLKEKCFAPTGFELML